MEIPKKTLEAWGKLKEEGDIALLAKEINKSEPTVYKIFSSGIAHVRDAAKINAFYKKRKKEVGSIKMEDDNN